MPEDRNALYRFLGFANYFRQFIRNYATIATPLYPLTQISIASEFTAQWTSLRQECFETLKLALSHAPTLKMPDFDKPFEVIVDASNIGVGAVLVQEGRPVAYESKKLTDPEMKWTTTERELWAAVHALRQWRCYLQHPTAPFNLWTDHNPNTFFSTTMRPLSQRQARWQEFMGTFNFNWRYKKGEDNIADALSRIEYSQVTVKLEATLIFINLEFPWENSEFELMPIETRGQRRAAADPPAQQPPAQRRRLAPIFDTNPIRRSPRVISNPPIPAAPTASLDPFPAQTSNPIPTQSPNPNPPPIRAPNPNPPPTRTPNTNPTQPPNPDLTPAQTPATNPARPPTANPPPAQTQNPNPLPNPSPNPRTRVGTGAPPPPHPPPPPQGAPQVLNPVPPPASGGPETPPIGLTAFEWILWNERGNDLFRQATTRRWTQDARGLWRDTQSRLVIPTDALRTRAIKECHDSIFNCTTCLN